MHNLIALSYVSLRDLRGWVEVTTSQECCFFFNFMMAKSHLAVIFKTCFVLIVHFHLKYSLFCSHCKKNSKDI